MKAEQTRMDGYDDIPVIKNDHKKRKREWENGFQKWSDEMQQNEDTHYGKCGIGGVCDFCDGTEYDPYMRKCCIRAFDIMRRSLGMKIDYNKQTYEDAFDGVVTKDGSN